MHFSDGLAAGEEKGLEKGRLLTARRLLVQVAEQRLGGLSAERRGRVEACEDAERLEELLLRLAVVADPGDVGAVLDEV